LNPEFDSISAFDVPFTAHVRVYVKHRFPAEIHDQFILLLIKAVLCSSS